MSTSTIEEERYVSSVLGASIPSFNEKYADKKTVTYYHVDIINHLTKKQWPLEKRYSDFKVLYDTLFPLIPNLPSIPGTTLFKVSSVDALNKRRIELEKFIKECFKRKDILSIPQFKEFIELEKNSSELIGNDVTKTFEYTNVPLGIRDFIHVPHKEIIIVCCSDMNIISRADSMLTNFTFPWEKKTDSHIPLGASFIYQCKPDGTGYIVHKIWAKSFPIQTGVISWEDDTEVLSIGLDDGKVYSFKHREGTHFLDMDLLIEHQLHKDRVMGLAYDKDNKYLYSCSTDKAFYWTELKEGIATSTLINLSRSGYTNLKFDKKNERLFLTNESGEFSVYLTNTYPPTETMNLQVSSYSCIRAMHIDDLSHYAFLGTVNGNIHILNLNVPGKEKFIRELSSFGANMKIRICRYNSHGHELITGDEDGKITVWSLKTGLPVYVWNAHPKNPITQIEFDVDQMLWWTGGKDKSFRVWKWPEKWDSKEMEKFETSEIKNINENWAVLRIQKTLKKEVNEESDSSDDDWNGWNFKQY